MMTAFAAPLPLTRASSCMSAPLATRRPLPLTARSSCSRVATTRCAPLCQHASQAPDYSSGFSPESDSDYAEVRVLSFGPCRNDSCLLTLSPVRAGKYAFKMCVTNSQAESIRAAFRQHACCNRPSTHDLFKKVLKNSGVLVVKAAITHIHDDVFIARTWLKMGQQPEFHVDCRPSDAIALALRSNAPLFLNLNLLKQWNMEIATIKRDAQHGVCEQVSYDDALKTTRSMREELQYKPEHVRLATLKMRLDVAIRTERYGEAATLKRMIDEICPIDRLQDELKRAVSEQRFLDAAGIQDRITVWRARLRMWEKGAIDLETFDGSDDVVNY